MIYFDNAATTYPKPESVISSVVDCLKNYCGNPGRSSHALAIKSAEEVFLTRERVANFFGIQNPERVIFTHNATDALNIAIKTTVKCNSHVITSDIEHNATVRPLHKLKKTKNISVSHFNSDLAIENEIYKLARPDTSCIISTLVSNVNGKVINLGELSAASRNLGIPLIVDASQAAGHIRINYDTTPFDAFCAPGHKSLFGIQGCGILIFSNDDARESFIEGGSGSESINPDMPIQLPERFEAGTQAVPSIVALRHGIEFINDVSLEVISKKLDNLTNEAKDRLSSLKRLKLISEGTGIISFFIDGIPSSEISSRLERYGICTRSGLHCSPDAHKKMGTLEYGTVRVSMSCFNSRYELDKLYEALKQICLEI